MPLACDSTGPKSDPPEEPPSEESPSDAFDAARMANTVDQIGTELQTAMPSPDTPLDERNLYDELLRTADGVQSISTVDTVIVHEETLSATAILENGLPYLIGNNRPSAAPLSTTSERGSARPPSQAPSPDSADLKSSLPSQEPPPSASQKSSHLPATLPQSNEAVAVAVDGGGAVAGQVADKLTEAGYEMSGLGASLQDMRSYDGLGVLYLDTHAALYKSIDENSSTTDRFGLQTSTTVQNPEEWIQNHKQALIDEKLLLSSFGASATPKVAITETFIREEWAFADNAFVMIHACFFGADEFEAADTTWSPASMHQAILQSAGALVSFDHLTLTRFADESILEIFDLLLGTNEDTYGRPWALASAQQTLAEKGLNQFQRYGEEFLGYEYGGNTVNVTYHGNHSTQLAPSIRRIQVVDDAAQDQGRLRLQGQFGSSEGTVTINATELSVEQWTEEEVVVQSPFSGAGSTGPVDVTIQDDVESNTVNLTQWAGTMTMTASPLTVESLEANSTVEVLFRADVHATRETPTSDPSYPSTVRTYISPASGGTLTGKGTHTNDDGSTLSWTGSSSYAILDKFQVDGLSIKSASSPSAPKQSASIPTQFGGEILLYPRTNSGSAEMCFRMGGMVTSEQTFSDGQTTTTDVPINPGLALARNGPAEGSASTLACLPLQWSGPTASSMTRSAATAELGNLEYEVSWSSFEAQNRPQ